MLCTLITMASLLIGTSDLAWAGNGYNIHYGKGPSFSRGTMMRNGTGASPRVSAGRSSYSSTRTVTPKRSFGTIKHESSTLQLRRHGNHRGYRMLSVIKDVVVSRRNTVALMGGRWTKQAAQAAVEKLGGKVVGAKYSDGKIYEITFKARRGSLLNRLGGIVHRINKKSQRRRKFSRHKKVSYGANLKTALIKQLKLKPGARVIYRTTKVKSYGKGSSYSQRRKGTFWVNMNDGKTTSHRGTLDIMITKSGKVRALKGTKALFVRKPAPKNTKPAANTNTSPGHSTYYNGVGRTGTHYSGGNPEAYARGLQAGLW